MTTMRQAFVETVSALLDSNESIVLLLGDISVHAFAAAKARHPKRVINCGVNEQSMVSMGAGLARAGMYPIMHTIAPFLVERAFEQIKIDFGYQRLPGCFVSVGASYDYATMGATHHVPGDVALLLTVPGVEIYVPGHADEVARLLPKIADGALAYVRLSEATNGEPIELDHHLHIRSDCRPPLVVSVGPTARLIPEGTNVLRMLRVDTFPGYAFAGWGPYKVLLLEPFYTGTLTHLVAEACPGAVIKSIGVPRRFITDYGSREDLDKACGFTPENVAQQLENLLNA